jgi:MFS transporter, PAT family, beta-lactamase induction signal transducer AmpG
MRIAWLLALYFAQGLPYGFQVTALPVYLRTEGVSLAAIGFVGVLSAPWMFKALWAPWVDRHSGGRFGHFRSWILPLQAALALTALAAAFVPAHELWLLLGLVFVMNLFAATQDIAVDGLAVRILRADELGRGNAVQVVGFKFGMLFGGGLLVWSSAYLGWRGLFLLMAAALSLVFLITTQFAEPASDEPRAHSSITGILKRLLAAARAPGNGLVLLAVASYKFGEYLIGVMFKPFLVDAGYSMAQIGLWVGTYGMLASLAGSALGGELGRKWSLVDALTFAALLRVGPLLSCWWLTRGAVSSEAVIAVTCAEHFAGGLITTLMFALMMARVDKRIGATHYTLLASVEVLGKSPATWSSGLLAERLGYGGLFLLGAALSLAFVLVPLAMRRNAERTISAPS